MRFMVIVKATAASEAGILPSAELIDAMGKFNQEMIDAGVMIAGDGLQASSKGARINISGDKRTVTDGPFPETKELIAGFWILKVGSKQEAIDWAMRAPNPFGEGGAGQIEVRQMFDTEDFADVASPEAIAQEIKQRERLGQSFG
jgi:hypothetical protein